MCAMTRDERSNQALCGARRKNGELCRLFAGQGTSHKGQGRCKLHGGCTPTQEKHVVKMEMQQRMVTYGAPDENVTALDALLSELYASSGHVAWLRRQIADMSQSQIATIEGQALIRLYDGERDRKARIARLAIESGVDEAKVIVMEQQCLLLGEALSRACDTAGLSAPMRRRVGVALRTELAAVGA
jgi:methylphosphotriester-DNA--protein-cysteine methyltransferase